MVVKDTDWLCEGYVNILIPRSRGMSRDISRFLGFRVRNQTSKNSKTSFIKYRNFSNFIPKIPKLLTIPKLHF